MGDVVEFLDYIDKLRGKVRLNNRTKKDPELSQALLAEVEKLKNWFSQTYPQVEFRATVTLSRHYEDVEVRKSNKYFRAEPPRYPKAMYKMHDTVSAVLWNNPFRLDMYISTYFEERKRLAQSFMENFN